ncbi:MAG: PspC domain-containing protein [Candidatus Heimdallarchaeota archaeon]
MPLYCPKCGATNEDFAQYCASCGDDLSNAKDTKEKAEPIENIEPEIESEEKAKKKLYRSRDEKYFGGVSAGLAKYFDMDLDTVRILWVVFLIASGGTALLIYLILMMAVPLEPLPGEEPETK